MTTGPMETDQEVLSARRIYNEAVFSIWYSHTEMKN